MEVQRRNNYVVVQTILKLFLGVMVVVVVMVE